MGKHDSKLSKIQVDIIDNKNDAIEYIEVRKKMRGPGNSNNNNPSDYIQKKDLEGYLDKDSKIKPENTTFFSEGLNKLDKTLIEYGKSIGTTGQKQTGLANTLAWYFFPNAKANQTYTFSGTIVNPRFSRVRFEDINGAFLGFYDPLPGGDTMPKTFTTPAGTTQFYINVQNGASVDINTLQIEEGSEATAYQAYKFGITEAYLNILNYYGKAASDARFSPIATSKIVEILTYVEKSTAVYTPVIDGNADLVYSAASSYSRKGQYQMFKGLTRKAFNSFTIPIVKDFKNGLNFTNGLTVRIILGSVGSASFLKEFVIPFSEVNQYNALTSASAPSAFDYNLILDYPLYLEPGQWLYIGWECIAVTDKCGSLFKITPGGVSDSTEYTSGQTTSSDTAGSVTSRTTIPNLLTTPAGFYLRVAIKMAANPAAINPSVTTSITNLAAEVAKNKIPVETLSFVDPLNYSVAKVVNNDANIVYQAGNSFKRKAFYVILKGISTKAVNTLIIPIVRNLVDELLFTDGVVLRAIFGTTVYTKNLSLADIAYYNTLGKTDSPEKFEYNWVLDAPFLFKPADLLFLGIETVSASDKMGSLFKVNPVADDRTEFTRNYGASSDTAGFVTNRITMPVASAIGGYYLRFSLGYAVSAGTKLDLAINPPKKIYSVVNDIIASEKGFARNNSVIVRLDTFLDGITSEQDLYFLESGTDKLILESSIEVIDANESNPGVLINGGANVYKINRTFTVTGKSIQPKPFIIAHINTKASAAKTIQERGVFVSTSIGYGELAKWQGDTVTKNFPLLIKQLYEKDKIDGGDIAGQYEFLALGTQKRSMTFNYKGIDRTISACHEGHRGFSIDNYMLPGQNSGQNPFWDSVNSKFSVKTWLDKYRTMDDNGVRLASNSPLKGTLVTDVNAYDVCLPTIFNIELGANDVMSGVTYVTKIQALIDLVKAEFNTYGWALPKFVLGIFDTAGTYFPSKYPQFDADIAKWKEVDSRHTYLYNHMLTWITTKLVTDNEDSLGVYLLPSYWTTPTAEGCSVREVPQNSDRDYFGTRSIYRPYGWKPYLHVNPYAHSQYAYQAYSLYKYISTTR